MSKANSNLRRIVAVSMLSAGCLAALYPALGADVPAGSGDAAATKSARPKTAQELLIERLVQRGALTQEDAAELLRVSEADAADSRVQAALTELATAQAAAARARADAALAQAATNKNPAKEIEPARTAPAPAVSLSQVVPTSPVSSAPAGAAAGVVEFQPPTSQPKPAPARPQPAPAAEPQDDSEDTVRVTYVPEAVKNQLREEIKNEVMQQAKEERWAAPRAVPDWVSRIGLYGDFRFRYEGIYNHQQNDHTGAFPNFNAINTGSPFDISGSVFSPQYNVDQNRSRVRLRARLGLAADLGDGFTSSFRMATGENSTPVSQNQSLGAAGSGQGGNFSKYSLWLDRACLKYQSDADLNRAITVTLGRFENPFLSTSIIWADDLGFDGAVLTLPAQIHFDGQVVDSVKPYFVVGAFPVFNTDLNFATNSPTKIKSNDKWLQAGQLGLDVKFARDFSLKLAGAYYYFTKTEGKLSTPFTPLTSSDAGDTDARRPSFAQKGNTYMRIRDITPDLSNSYGNSNQWQYFGLASAFRDVVFDLRLDYNHFEPFQVSLIAEYIQNQGFNKTKVQDRSPVNNLATSSTDFVGGGNAWVAGVRVGDAVLQKRWDWSLSANYREVDSDAVIDGFCDSDFGGGGTNVKGLTLAGSLALSKRVSFGAKWMSSTQVAGPTNKNDILQIDLNAKY